MSQAGDGLSDQHRAIPMRVSEHGYPYEDEINLLDYGKVIWGWRWMIAGLCLVATLTTMVVSLMSPKVYTSKVTMMTPAQSGGSLSSLTSSESQLVQGLLGGGAAPAGSMVMALLNSRTMAEEIATHFDLVTLFETETLHAAAGVLQGMTEIESEDGVIAITVEAKDPNLAADLANYYVESLDRMNQSMSLTAAKRNRIFVQERLQATIKELRQTEDNIKDFQLKNMAVFLKEQVAGAMSEAGDIQNQMTEAELKLNVLGSYLRSEHPDFIRLGLELEYLKEKLRHVEMGPSEKGQLPGDRVYPAWISVPDLSVKLGQHTRELELKEAVYKLLTTQLEQAKIAEVKDDPTVQVLDPALPSAGPSKPRVRFATLISGILTLLVGAILAFVLDYARRMSAGAAEVAIS